MSGVNLIREATTGKGGSVLNIVQRGEGVSDVNIFQGGGGGGKKGN